MTTLFGHKMDKFPIKSTAIHEYCVHITREFSIPTHERKCIVSSHAQDGLIWITVMAATGLSQTTTCMDIKSAKAFAAILQRAIQGAEIFVEAP